MNEQNISINEKHYDEVYKSIDISLLVHRIMNRDEFFTDAINTDASWHGFYKGEFADRINGKKILELGSGDGLNAFIMASFGAKVTAIDISPQSKVIIDKANAFLGTSVTALAGDFRQIDFPDKFDFIVGKAFLHHLNHEVENQYLRKIASLLAQTGEARFFESAVNSPFLDEIRWIIPVPGRPSKLNRKAFDEWKKNDPHPVRDNSTRHYIQTGRQYFNIVETEMIGSLERLYRLLPNGKFNRSYRQFAHKLERKLPRWLRYYAARSQLIVYKDPKPII